jgi:glycosyltransferase involved in cell wall biosynthesis
LPCGPIGLFGLWMCGVPYVLSLQAGDVPGAERSVKYLHRLLASIRRAILKNSIGVVANSDGLRKLSEAADPISVHVVPNGVDTEFFCPSVTQSPAERSGRRLRVLFVGRFQDQKNLGFLLEQLTLLSPGTFELHLVGDGPQRNKLQDLADRLSVGGCIRWHGWVPRAVLPTIYRSADCFVNSSLYEGMPIAILEAMACGLPVIASNVIGNADLVLNGETGFLFDLRDSNGFVAAVNQLQDVDLRRQMGKQGRARAIECFSWKTAAAQYAHLLSAGGTCVN